MVRKHLQLYPEISEMVSEVWQAAKWLKEIDIDDLTPMWADWKNAPHQHFYIKEVARLMNGELVVPVRWLVWKKAEHAEACRVKYLATVSHNPFGTMGTHWAAAANNRWKNKVKLMLCTIITGQKISP